MTFNEYQKKAISTAIYPQVGENIYYPVLGLCGEAGEVAEKVKKIMRDDYGVISEEKRQELRKELGDVLWYVAMITYELGIELDGIAELNVQKLASRKERNALHGNGDNR